MQSQTGTGSTNYHLTTKELDPDTGLYYFIARWYDPVEGRFISEDPKPEANLYWYCANNPVNYVDHYGLYTWPYTAKGWAGVIAMGTGAVMMSRGILLPGIVIAVIGTGLTGWDLIEGVNQVKKDACEVGNKWTARDQDEWDQINKYFESQRR